MEIPSLIETGACCFWATIFKQMRSGKLMDIDITKFIANFLIILELCLCSNQQVWCVGFVIVYFWNPFYTGDNNWQLQIGYLLSSQLQLTWCFQNSLGWRHWNRAGRCQCPHGPGVLSCHSPREQWCRKNWASSDDRCYLNNFNCQAQVQVQVQKVQGPRTKTWTWAIH